MKKNKNKILWRFIILLIVSAAFILARFSIVSAGETESKVEEVSAVQVQNDDNKSPAYSFPVGSADNESLTGPLIKLIIALIVIVAGIYGFLIVLRKMMGSRFSGNRGSRLIEVLETTYIAQKKSISLIRYGDKAVLVGVAEGAISVLAELNPEETGKVLSEVASGKSDKGFKSIFAGARDKIRTFDMKKLSATWTAKEADRPQTA